MEHLPKFEHYYRVNKFKYDIYNIYYTAVLHYWNLKIIVCANGS